MYIIQIEATENGARPPLQSWSKEIAPDGYALCPDSFFDTFYSTNPAGFVNIQIDQNIVTKMEVNQAALDAYISSLPEESTDTVDKPSQLDAIEAQVTYTAIMTDTLLEG